MNDGQKRRHIRDIAHLYISGSLRRDPAPHVSLLITGESKRCFPGFHAANLAAALAVRGCEVRLNERSGLLPNAGFYLSLPPCQYIRWGEEDAEPAPGLAGVSVDCAEGTVGAPKRDTARARVEMLHLPLLSEEESLETSVQQLGNIPQLPVVVVVVRFDRGPVHIPTWFSERLRPDAAFVLHMGDNAATRHGADQPRSDAETPTDQAGEPPCTPDPTFPELGSVAGWESALADRVAIVVRAPDTALARAYLAAADTLRFRIDELRRTFVGPTSAEDSAGIGSGSADRRSRGEGSVLPISRFGTRHSRRGSG